MPRRLSNYMSRLPGHYKQQTQQQRNKIKLYVRNSECERKRIGMNCKGKKRKRNWTSAGRARNTKRKRHRTATDMAGWGEHAAQRNYLVCILRGCGMSSNPAMQYPLLFPFSVFLLEFLCLALPRPGPVQYSFLLPTTSVIDPVLFPLHSLFRRILLRCCRWCCVCGYVASIRESAPPKSIHTYYS